MTIDAKTATQSAKKSCTSSGSAAGTARPRLTQAAVAILGALAAGGVFSQNLVVNPGFDSDVSGWNFDGNGSIAWSMTDANGQPGSGSTLITNGSPGPSNGTGIAQCLPMPTRTAYRFRGKAMVPSGPNQLLSNSVYVDIRFMTNGNCTTAFDGPLRLGSDVSQFDSWKTFGPQVHVAPGGVRAVQIRGTFTKFPAGGSAIALFDDFFVESETHFLDGFE